MRQRTSWLVGALCVSIAINMALAGFFLGKKTNDVQVMAPVVDPGIGIRQALSHLPEDRREEVLARIEDHHKSSRREIRALMRKVHRHRREIWSLIQDQQVDSEEVVQSLQRYRDTLADAQDRMDQWMVQLVSSMSVEERRMMLKKHRATGRFGTDIRHGPRQRDESQNREGSHHVPAKRSPSH